MLHAVNEGKLGFERAVQLLCEAPARIFNVPDRGRIEVGNVADLALVDMNLQKSITREMVASKCGWSPYEWFTLKGWPVATVVNGELIMENGKVTGGKDGKDLFV